VLGFEGDTSITSACPRVRAPREGLAERAKLGTTLWFWNSRSVGRRAPGSSSAMAFAYVNANIWNKGIAHIAGTSTRRRSGASPSVTEVCVQYIMERASAD